MLIEKETAKHVTSLNQLPKILSVNANAEPLKWLTYEDYCKLEVKGKILWSMGKYEVILRGGTNAKTGRQSTLTIDTIVAVKNDKSPYSYRRHAPALSNRALFERDKCLCAYCGNKFKRHELSADHVIPKSKGGKDTWENLVAACKPCNGLKDARTPEQAGMELLYVPYTPNYYETLILEERNILADQMEFLMKGVHKHSRLHLNA